MSPVSESEWLEVYPSNDLWANAQVIEGTEGSVPGTLVGSWTEDALPPLGQPDDSEPYWDNRTWLGNDNNYSVWYKWIPQVSGYYFFEVNHDDTLNACLDVVVDSTSATSGTVIAWNENRTNVDVRPRLGIYGQAGTEYCIRVAGDVEAPFQLAWGPTTVQSNHTVLNPIDIRIPGDIPGSLMDGPTEYALRAISEDPEGNFEHPEPLPSAWYTYTNRTTQPVLLVVDAIPETTDNELAFYTHTGVLEDFLFDGYFSPDVDMRVVLEPGEQVKFAVFDDWYEGGMCDFTLTVRVEEVPYKSTSLVLTAFDPTSAKLTSNSSRYGIYSIHPDGVIEPILVNSPGTPCHPLAAVLSRLGNLWYIDQEEGEIEINFGNSMWKYLEGTSAVAGVEAPDYDDSSWAIGRVPFGPTGFTVSGISPKTIVPTGAGRHLYLRRTVRGPGQLSLNIARDDNVEVWVDGISINSEGTSSWAASYASMFIAGTTLTEGDHVVVIRRRDNGGGANWFDCHISVVATNSSISPSKNYTIHRVIDGVDTNVIATTHTNGILPIPSEGTRFTPRMTRNDKSSYPIWSSYTNNFDMINLLPVSDGSFETGEITPWTSATSTTITADSTRAAHGSWSMKMINNGSLGSGVQTLVAYSGFIDLNTMTRPGNNRYFSTAQFYWTGWNVDVGQELNTTCAIQLDLYNSSFTLIGQAGVGLWSYPYTTGSGPPGFWTNSISGSSNEFTIPFATRYVKFVVFASRVNIGAQIWVDKIGLFENPYWERLQNYGATWRMWTPEQKLENPHQWQSGYRDPVPFGAGMGGMKYVTGSVGFPPAHTEEYKLAQTSGGADEGEGEFSSWAVAPEDPTLEVYLQHTMFSSSERFLLYKRNTVDNSLTGTLAEYLTSIHDGIEYPWMNVSQTGPGEESRLHFMNSNDNLFFAAQLENCTHKSVAFELTQAGELVAVYPDTKMAPRSFASIVRRPKMAGIGSYSCPDPDGLHFWVIDYDVLGSPVYKVPYEGLTAQTPISSLAPKFKPTYLVPHLRVYPELECDVEGWWNCNYIYRKEINITAPAVGLEVLHPISISMAKTDSLDQGKIRTNLADIEIIYSEDEDYVILEHIITETATHIEVLFPMMSTLAGGGSPVGKYHVYYGNPELIEVPTLNLTYDANLWPSSLDLTSDLTYTMPGMDWVQSTSSKIGAKAVATFYGKAVRVRANKHRSAGIVEVEIDGVTELVDLYSSSTQYDVEVFSIDDLSDEQHVLRLTVSAESSPSTAGNAVEITGVDIFKNPEVELSPEEIIPLRWTSGVGSNH